MPLAMSAPGDLASVTGPRQGGVPFFNGSVSAGDVEVVAGTVQVQVVGTKYYKGGLGVGEVAAVVREPQNAHDPNALKVLNVTKNHSQVGHLPRSVASILSPLLDQKFITTSTHVAADPSQGPVLLTVTVLTLCHHLVNGIGPTLQGCPGFRAAQVPRI